ncbi:putative FAD-linked oxidoreductase [Glarea lozoyensis 74030]|uniref:Putative FAD-linked oxidoreductase n=1 Tax=Glarea lozoyensis (strain ATCC 74030 / MF5533) TaxID=1104152 RepID=H0ELF8_GLAL7|nr:putative FAD-linked oxidoreductase [Glarea lozoyensis 74030]
MAVKNREARLHRPAAIMRPTEVRHVQQCVRWALKHGVGLTVIGGGHGGQCLWPNVVAVDMSNFNAIHILPEEQSAQDLNRNSGPLVVVEAGCKTGDIIGSTMGAGVTVPLGSRPSVGAGLWLQGGIGHLARIHGLACDSIVGAVVVSVSSGHIVYAGCVPSQYRPAGAVLAENESDLLWAIKGAGTNFGIVVSVTFESHKALKFLTRNWILPLKNSREAEIKLNEFDSVVAKKLTRNNSADAYLYWDAGKLHLGVTVYESSTKEISYTTHTSGDVSAVLGMEHGYQIVDAVGLFDTEMYMSRMHGGHSGGKTSSFKRCVFLKNIGEANIANRLIAAIEARPASFCYLHLLHGGGAVTDIAPEATAFGCRDWDFACVITSVWPRDQDGGEVAQAAVTWVYSVVEDLSSLSCGVYGADLGPDPRDAALAARAFGPNLPRLAKLKRDFDPHNVLAYACPLPRATTKQRLIILITGESFAGKDYCAEIWLSAFNRCSGVKAKVVSISSATKREYAVATGASITLLLNDRTYKEQHREALTAFFNEQLKQRPQMLSEQFLDAVQAASDVDVLMISGMREDAPVARYSHLVPDSRLIEVYIETSQQTRQIRRGHYGIGNYTSHNDGPPKRLNYRPTFTFHNNKPGTNPPKQFFETHLLPILHTDLERLTKQLLGEDGVGVEDVNAMVVAEFPVHQGRELLRKRGFGRVGVQSLLVFEDA